MARPHHRLVVWKRSIGFVKCIYQMTAHFPSEERFGLISQMRRAAVSVPSNIAEGAARSTKQEFLYYLHIAQGSTAELETQLMISRELDFLATNQLEPVMVELDEISKMIIGLQRTLH